MFVGRASCETADEDVKEDYSIYSEIDQTTKENHEIHFSSNCRFLLVVSPLDQKVYLGRTKDSPKEREERVG